MATAPAGTWWGRGGKTGVDLDKSYDVVIAGGGVIGSAIAYFLAASDAFTGTVLVVEKDASYRFGSTALSAGSIRQQFSTPENIEMSRYGIRFLKNIGDYLTVDGEAPALSFVEAGYLFLASAAGLPILKANNAIQRSHGVDVALLSPAELAQQYPWLTVDDLAAGSFGLRDEGWFDAYGLLQGFRRKARHLGVTYIEDELIGVQKDGQRVAACHLKSTGVIGCGTLVNAAGARAAEVAAMLGVALPVRPRKRQVFVISCRTKLPDCPLVIDPSGLYFRPEGDTFICGQSPPEGNDPDCLDFEVDHSLFEEVLWPLLAGRVAAFEAVKPVNAWAGHYAYNTFDQNAILGPHPEIRNFLFANGFSGHGLQQSPAVGRAIAEDIIFGAFRSLNLSRLGYDRLQAGRPVIEQSVV